MTPSEKWMSFFANWPAGFPRNGILISILNESIPFRNFWLNGDMLLLERTNPDAMGGRFLLMGFEVINSVKFINPLSAAIIAESGFVAKSSDMLQPC